MYRFQSSEYFNKDYIVLDFETTNLDTGSALNRDNKILCLALKTKNSLEKIKVNNQLALTNLLLEKLKDKVIVAHNSKFELHWLRRLKIPLHNLLVFDTMLAEYTLLGNKKQDLTLDFLAEKYFKGHKSSYVSSLISSGVCPSNIPDKFLIDYCAQDILLTEKIFLLQLDLLEKRGLLPVLYTKCKVVLALTDMEAAGMYLDKEAVIKEHYASVERYNNISKELTAITGGINMASPKQVSAFIYGKLGFSELKNKDGSLNRTAKGNPRTDEEVILSLTPKTKEQKLFLSLKREESILRKRITSYTETFLEAVQKDCMLYGKLNQAITGTHRLSSSSPNLQNIDRDLKKLFISRNKGWKIRQNDYSKLEFVVAGYCSQDPVILEGLNNNEDVHRYTACVLLGLPLEAVSDSQRTAAKKDTFGPLYGKTSGTPAQKKYFADFKNKYKVLSSVQGLWINEALETGKLKTVTGLTFTFPSVKYTKTGYIEGSTQVRNYPIQYFATGEIALIGTFLLWLSLKEKKMKSFMINTVHDSDIIEEAPEESKEVEQLSYSCMQEGVIEYLHNMYGINFNYPLKIDSSLKETW